jgi:hypothetical protein
MRSEEVLRKTSEGMKEGNKILIQELVHDLESKGIVPVWASDEGKVRKLKIIHESELEDFERAVKEWGTEKADFCLLEEDLISENNALPCLKKIIIIHKKSGMVKEYSAGEASHWVSAFVNDLKNKFFE